MADKYIRKADAVDAVEFGITLASAINIETGERTELFQRENDELREAVKRIKDIEPADVVKVRHGKWMKEDRGHVEYCAVCDQCGFDWMWSDRGYFKFCPNCGAKMVEKTKMNEDGKIILLLGIIFILILGGGSILFISLL